MISETESGKITTEYIQENSKMKEPEIIEVFDYLIKEEKVKKYYTYKEKSVSKVDGIDYLYLSKKSAIPNNAIATNRSVIIIKWIGWFITVTCAIICAIAIILDWI